MRSNECLVKQILFVAQEPSTYLADEERKNYESTISGLKEELKQSHQLAEMYREQVLRLEDQVSKQIEKGNVTQELFKGREDKLTQRLKLCTDRYKELERRRQMEIEGFTNELRQLRDKLRRVEKNLFKVSIERDETAASATTIVDLDDKDVLRNIHETTQRSRDMQCQLQHLKAKIYSIENDIRRL